MAAKKGGNTAGLRKSSNTLELLEESDSSSEESAIDSLASFGGDMLDQLLGVQSKAEASETGRVQLKKQEKQTGRQVQKEANLFNYQHHHETVIVKRQIEELIQQIRKEVDYLKQANASLLQDVKDIEKIALYSLPENPGVYDVRFLEIILRMLQSVRLKVGESRTWLSALVSKKKKRGSLFAVRSKKAGTSYSLSQELSTARNIQ